MLGVTVSIEPGICEVHTTEFRGFTPEEIDAALANEPEKYSPTFRLIWVRR